MRTGIFMWMLVVLMALLAAREIIDAPWQLFFVS